AMGLAEVRRQQQQGQHDEQREHDTSTPDSLVVHRLEPSESVEGTAYWRHTLSVAASASGAGTRAAAALSAPAAAGSLEVNTLSAGGGCACCGWSGESPRTPRASARSRRPRRSAATRRDAPASASPRAGARRAPAAV